MTNKIKWTKGDFEITTGYIGKERKEQRTGYVSEFFSIHKSGKYWIVTHRPSGDTVSIMNHRLLKRVKANIEAVSSIDWSETNGPAIANANQMSNRDLLDFIRSGVENAA